MASIIPLEKESLPANCFVFKHSTTCPVSAHAAAEVKGHNWDLPLYWINVIEQRPLSNWITQQYEVQHESPQLLQIEDGRAKRVLNHRAIVRSAFL